MPASTSKLADAIAALLGQPAVRHLLNVVVTLLTGYLLLRFGGMLPPGVAIQSTAAPIPVPEAAPEVAAPASAPDATMAPP